MSITDSYQVFLNMHQYCINFKWILGQILSCNEKPDLLYGSGKGLIGVRPWRCIDVSGFHPQFKDMQLG